MAGCSADAERRCGRHEKSEEPGLFPREENVTALITWMVLMVKVSPARISQMLSGLLHIHCPKVVFEAGTTHTSELTLEYMAPLSTSPLRIQMMDAAGLALSAWQVRLRGSPARRLTTGPPLMTGFSGGTETRREDTPSAGYSGTCVEWATIFNQDDISLFLFVCTCSSSFTFFKCGEYERGRSVVIFWGFFSFFFF